MTLRILTLSALVLCSCKNESSAASATSTTPEVFAVNAPLADFAGRIGDQPLFFSHPVYQYLEVRYSLNGHSLHWDPGEGRWAMLDKFLEKRPAKIMVRDDTPLDSITSKLREHGITVLVIKTGGNLPAGLGYIDLMKENLSNFVGG